MRRRAGIVLAAVLLVLAAIEVASYGFLRLVADDLRFPDPRRYLATPDEIARAQKSFDPQLGWVVRYDTPFGERPREREYGRPLAAAFGDSFTHGDEVEDAETWPEQLARILAADVYNFGASAYGMDQALLRMERDLGKTGARLAIFAFMTYDVERNVSVYWKFLSPPSGLALTKPRFVLEGGSLKLIPNPILSADDVPGSLTDESFLREIGKYDRWYNPHGLSRPRFPYTLSVLSPSFLAAVVESRRKRDLWRVDETRTIAELILRRFRDEAAARGADAVFVHLPVSWEITEYAKTGDLPTAVPEFLRICKKHALDCHAPITETAGMTPAEIAPLFTKGLEGGHYSPRGNRLIAEYVAHAVSARDHVINRGAHPAAATRR